MTDQDLIERIDEEGRRLTSWEIDFVEDMIAFVERHGAMTARQRGIAERIFRERVPDQE